jgi:[protein-PII] uridylyltransferase
MAAIAEAGRTIAWVTDDVWRRRSLWTTPPGRRRRRAAVAAEGGEGDARRGLRPVEPGVALAGDRRRPFRQGETVVLGPDADIDGDPACRCGSPPWPPSGNYPSPGHPRHPGRATPPPRPVARRHARSARPGPRHRPPAITALEALDQRGLLVRLIPEWAAVRNRPQRNAFHRFTVDRHLLEAAAEAAALAPA